MYEVHVYLASMVIIDLETLDNKDWKSFHGAIPFVLMQVWAQVTYSIVPSPVWTTVQILRVEAGAQATMEESFKCSAVPFTRYMYCLTSV